MQKDEINVLNNTVLLANAAELVSATISKIAGNDISNSLNGNTLTKTTLVSLVCQRIASNIKK